MWIPENLMTLLDFPESFLYQRASPYDIWTVICNIPIALPTLSFSRAIQPNNFKPMRL